MRAAGLQPIFEAPGPFLSLYLGTGGDVENAAQRLEVRWKSARGDLQERGCRSGAGGGRSAGRGRPCGRGDPGRDRPARRRRLPRRIAVPAGPRGAGPLGRGPYALPLLAHAQSQIPFVAVLASRAAAEIVAKLPDGERSEQMEGEQGPHPTRSKPGGWSQPRHQHRAEVIWERNASEVADALTRLVDEARPRLVAAAGDARALQLLREQSPKRSRS